MNQFYRQPAKERKISEISREADIWVGITGTIVDVSDDSFVLDDGTGAATISVVDQSLLASVENGSFVRVICRVIPTDDSYELRASVIQKIENRELYLRVLSFLNEQ